MWLLLDQTSGSVLGPATLKNTMAPTIHPLRGTWELASMELWELHKVCVVATTAVPATVCQAHLLCLDSGKHLPLCPPRKSPGLPAHGADYAASVSRFLCVHSEYLQCLWLQPCIKHPSQATVEQYPSSTHEFFWHNTHRSDSEQVCWCKYLKGCKTHWWLRIFLFLTGKEFSFSPRQHWAVPVLWSHSACRCFWNNLVCGTKGPGDTGMNNCGPLSRSPMNEGDGQRNKGW